MWALKVDINLLNQHCKPTDGLADWLTDWLKQFGTQRTEGTKNLEHLRQSKGTRALNALERHVRTPALRAHCALGALRHLGTQGIRVLGHMTLEGHLSTHALTNSKSTWALDHSGTQAPEHLGTWDTRGTFQ